MNLYYMDGSCLRNFQDAVLPNTPDFEQVEELLHTEHCIGWSKTTNRLKSLVGWARYALTRKSPSDADAACHWYWCWPWVAGCSVFCFFSRSLLTVYYHCPSTSHELPTSCRGGLQGNLPWSTLLQYKCNETPTEARRMSKP